MDMNPPPLELKQDAAMCEEAKSWLAFAKEIDKGGDWKNKLQSLNNHLLKRSVVCGSGITISPVDMAVFLAVRDAVVKNVIPTQAEYPNVVRWFDYVQGEGKVSSLFVPVPVKKSNFEPQDYSDVSVKKAPKVVEKVATIECVPATDSLSVGKEDTKHSKVLESKEQEPKAGASSKEEKKGKKEKAATPKIEEKKADEGVSISALDIRVGLIVKVWKHPSADALFVEEIDLGEGSVRQVVSGLARYLKEEDLLNRKVVLIANVKPGKLRDVMSSGLVLCASNSDHSSVEPLIVPDGAVVGEKITFAGYEGKPEEVLNPKKKQLEKIFPDLCTDDSGLAIYKGVSFMTSAGPCRSTLLNAIVR
ncbi:hypothetical protein KP509_34G059700 [Ceratopteris richardii]|nr:hypothetical protein KP509_34G059700 [Ceratopteris richardii]